MKQKFSANGKLKESLAVGIGKKVIFVVLIIAFFTPVSRGQIVIDEVMANNKTFIKSNTGKYSDWFELYNKGTDSVDIAGWMISDDPGNPSRYVIPSGMSDSTIIYPHGFMVLWADGGISAGIRHLPFKLKKKREILAIYSLQQGNPVCIDSIRYQSMRPDISFGRKPDGEKSWTNFKNPTPGTKNF